MEDVLEAARIEPYVDASSNHVQNSIPLRRDLHMLHDAQLLGIDVRGAFYISSGLANGA